MTQRRKTASQKAADEKPDQEMPAKTNPRQKDLGKSVEFESETQDAMEYAARSRRVAQTSAVFTKERESVRRLARDRARNRTDLDPDDDRIYVLRCPANHLHVAAVFSVQPQGRFPAGEQIETTYSPFGLPLHGDVVCQVCRAGGVETKINFAQRLVDVMTRQEYLDMQDGKPTFLQRRESERQVSEEEEYGKLPTSTEGGGARTAADLARHLASRQPQYAATFEVEKLRNELAQVNNQADAAERRGDLERAEALRSRAGALQNSIDSERWDAGKFPTLPDHGTKDAEEVGR